MGDGEHLHHELLLALASPLAALAAPASGPPAAGAGAELLGGLGRVLIINCYSLISDKQCTKCEPP